MLVLNLVSLSKLKHVCLIFKLLLHQLQVQLFRVLKVEVKLHFTHSRLFDDFVITILCRIKTLLVVQYSHIQVRVKGFKLLVRVPVTHLINFVRLRV